MLGKDEWCAVSKHIHVHKLEFKDKCLFLLNMKGKHVDILSNGVDLEPLKLGSEIQAYENSMMPWIWRIVVHNFLLFWIIRYKI